jgi:hypothetical protein
MHVGNLKIFFENPLINFGAWCGVLTHARLEDGRQVIKVGHSG